MIQVDVGLGPKTLYMSRVNLMDQKLKFWSGFGPVGSTEKAIGDNYEQLLRTVFSCFHGITFHQISCQEGTCQIVRDGFVIYCAAIGLKDFSVFFFVTPEIYI